MGRPRLYEPDEAVIRQKIAIKQWKESHREEINVYMREWRRKHRDKIRNYNRFAYLRKKFLSLQVAKGSVNVLSHDELIELEPLIIRDCQSMTQVKVALRYHISRRTVQRIVAKHNPNSKYYEPPKTRST